MSLKRGFKEFTKNEEYLESIQKRFPEFKGYTKEQLTQILDDNTTDLNRNLKAQEENEDTNNLDFLGYTQDKKNIYDRYDSHLNVHQDIIPLLPEILSQTTTKDKDFIIQTIDLKRIIGKTDCVPTTKEDEDKGNIVFKKREGRRGLSRYVKNKEALETQKATVILKKQDYENYILITARIGEQAEPEVRDSNAFSKAKNPEEAKEKSKKFRDSHAFILREDKD